MDRAQPPPWTHSGKTGHQFQLQRIGERAKEGNQAEAPYSERERSTADKASVSHGRTVASESVSGLISHQVPV